MGTLSRQGWLPFIKQALRAGHAGSHSVGGGGVLPPWEGKSMTSPSIAQDTEAQRGPIWPTWKTTALKNFGTLRVLSPLVVSSSLWPPWTVACQAPLSMEFSRQKYWCGLLFPSPVDLPNPEIEPRSPALQVDSEPLGKPKNTGVGNLSLLRGIFPTQESNRGLLHCRWILYQLSHQGIPYIYIAMSNLNEGLQVPFTC